MGNQTTRSLLALALLKVIDAQNFGQFLQPGLQDYIVQQHNLYRSTKLGIPAANMLKMEWSNDMAQKAERWARTCQFQHFTEGYGQNLYEDWGFDPTIDTNIVDGFMNAWGRDEMQSDIARARPSAVVGKEVGVGIWDHYTQIVWATTKQVGCAYSLCPGNTRIVVCNYYPPGNDVTRGWYIFGNACSRCPPDTTCEAGLCAAKPRGNPPVVSTGTLPSPQATGTTTVSGPSLPPPPPPQVTVTTTVSGPSLPPPPPPQVTGTTTVSGPSLPPPPPPQVTGTTTDSGPSLPPPPPPQVTIITTVTEPPMSPPAPTTPPPTFPAPSPSISTTAPVEVPVPTTDFPETPASTPPVVVSPSSTVPTPCSAIPQVTKPQRPGRGRYRRRYRYNYGYGYNYRP